MYKPHVQIKKGAKKRKHKTFEIQEIKVQRGEEAISLFNVYRPPYSVKNSATINEFMNEFDECLDDVSFRPNIALVGDFNIHVERENDNDAKKT